MERQTGLHLKFVIVFVLFCTASSENDWNFCGTWHHGSESLMLKLNISTGCNSISISANESYLSVNGQFTVHCKRSDVIDLSKQFGLNSSVDTDFCLYWEPSLDQLKLEIGNKTLSLCWPTQLLDVCCSYLTYGPNKPEGQFGIRNGSVKKDVLAPKTRTGYEFSGMHVDYTTLCDEWWKNSAQVNRIGDRPCPRSSVLDPRGKGSVVNFNQELSAEPSVIVQIPSTFQHHIKNTSKVVVTSYKRNTLFQEAVGDVQVIDDVVEIIVGNEIITDLTDPIRIDFLHDPIPKLLAFMNYVKLCLNPETFSAIRHLHSTDSTEKPLELSLLARHVAKLYNLDSHDPLQVNWLMDGCETQEHGGNHTECHCTHLTYFSILVQLEPRPVRHLLALTIITSLGCAVSFICCIALIIHLCRKSQLPKEQSNPIHLCLVLSLTFLYLLFFFTGILANVGEGSMCEWVAAGMHYALLSSLTWMGIEVFHTFWLIYMVFNPPIKPFILYLIGFILPAVPVAILFRVGGIYGVRKVEQDDDPSDTYLMCWMMDTEKAFLAHYCTNLTALGALLLSGLAMLFLVYRQIRARDEWKQRRVTFLSIWGLSCLFGTSWGLIFLDFGYFSTFAVFFFCILNSFQGLLLMLRFCVVNWMRRHTSGLSLSGSSTSSTRQHMLQAQEK